MNIKANYGCGINNMFTVSISINGEPLYACSARRQDTNVKAGQKKQHIKLIQEKLLNLLMEIL